jgi:eukaryotic-like serine/threonine-protein kinase
MAHVLTPPKLSGMNYRVIKPLGTGAGSTILLISDKEAGGKRYALKVVRRLSAADDIYVNQARHEFEVAQRLHHPAIVKIYDCRTKRAWFRVSGVELLMEYVEGQSLEEVERPKIGPLVIVFHQVASALVHMHRRGIYHGDLKPSNIMATESARVKLIDFGTAWIKGQEKGRVQGTPSYMAPEQATDRIVDDRTDIYNFGATMYRMFTGRYANPETPMTGGVDVRKLVAPIEVNERIPGTLNETIMACLQWQPERRPAGMFEVEHQLKAVARYMKLKLKSMDLADDGDIG